MLQHLLGSEGTLQMPFFNTKTYQKILMYIAVHLAVPTSKKIRNS
jgi:hypothetical protein